jgi:hypothetical protein
MLTQLQLQEGSDAVRLDCDALFATSVVSSYDLRTDSWSELPARLPLPLSHACPVAVRMPGVQL